MYRCDETRKQMKEAFIETVSKENRDNQIFIRTDLSRQNTKEITKHAYIYVLGAADIPSTS